MHALIDFCNEGLREVGTAHLRRTLRVSDNMFPVEMHYDDALMVSFAGNDYLGLRHHPDVIRAGVTALKQYGAGAGASRLVTGNHPLYAPLEMKLAEMKGTQRALVFGSGYLANLGVITALMNEGDLILADKFAHACILDGAQLSGATLKRFRHNDAAHAQSLLSQYRAQYRHTLIVTEHIFSMDGDEAPIAELSALAKQHDAWLMVDDAHGIQKPEIRNQKSGIDIHIGTLSKAVGAYGGYAAAAWPVIDYLINHARSFIFSTGLPPAVCASALRALEIMEAEPERCERPLRLARLVTSALNLPQAQSAIVPIITGSAKTALALSERLKAQGILAVAIRPPTVPPNTSRVRLTFSAAHTDSQVEKLIAVLREAMAALEISHDESVSA